MAEDLKGQQDQGHSGDRRVKYDGQPIGKGQPEDQGGQGPEEPVASMRFSCMTSLLMPMSNAEKSGW